MHDGDPRQNHKHRERGPTKLIFNRYDIMEAARTSHATLERDVKAGRVDVTDLSSIVHYVNQRRLPLRHRRWD